MTQTAEPTHTEPATGTNLAAAIQEVLAASPEPLTVPKIRERLRAPFRAADPGEVNDSLTRQVAANVIYQYPKYRSQQDRFWDRDMPTHVAYLLQVVLEEGPLAKSELRRKLPAYAVVHAEAILDDQVVQGKLHRHPRASKRGNERFGVRPPDAKDYLRDSLAELFSNMMQDLGFTEAQLREGALELLHDEEWSPRAMAAAEEAGEPVASEAPSPTAATSESRQPAPSQPSQP